MKSSSQIQPAGWESRFLARLIDPGKKIDYLVAFVIGALPIVVAYLVGAANTIELSNGKDTISYRGYLNYPNWWSLALLIPAALFALRWLMSRTAPVHVAWPPAIEPPLLKLVSDESSKPAVYSSLRRRVLSQYNLLCAFGIVLLVTILDGWPIVLPYFSDAVPLYTDWTSMFKIDANTCGDSACHQISKAANLTLVVIAGLAQATITFIGIIAIVFLCRHNRFFIRNVYQRRRTTTIAASEMFQIDVTDVDRCFGFRKANSAFSTQVIALMIGGMAMAVSRYAFTVQSNASNDSAKEINESWAPIRELIFSSVNYVKNLDFSLAGQWLMPLVWLVAYCIVAMPVLVKLLPRLSGLMPRRLSSSPDRPYKQSDDFDGSIRHYLREFFSDDGWPRDPQGDEESVSLVAARFASNAFWPTGDNRARQLFVFSWWVFFFTLLPPPLSPLLFILFMVMQILFAYIFTLGTYKLMKLLLGYVDGQLVNASMIDIESEEHPDGLQSIVKQDVGVFLSYRRKDTVEYARSIHAELQNHFLEERLFRDLSAIEPGENFVTAIDRSLEQVDTILVLIGADWVSSTDSQGRRRLHKPDDMVRMEVATALNSGKRVIPVLLEDAAMPSQSELPDVLHGLCMLNALEISDSRWDYDLGRLIEALKTS